MHRNQPQIPIIVPESNAEIIYKYLVGAVSLLGAYAAIVHAWYNSRFKGVDERIDAVIDDVKENSAKVSEHESRLAAFEVHIQHGNQQRTEIKSAISNLDKKLDKIIGGN